MTPLGLLSSALFLGFTRNVCELQYFKNYWISALLVIKFLFSSWYSETLFFFPWHKVQDSNLQKKWPAFSLTLGGVTNLASNSQALTNGLCVIFFVGSLMKTLLKCHQEIRWRILPAWLLPSFSVSSLLSWSTHLHISFHK